MIGEFNSGKTALVNALLGAPVLPASFTTHTAYPTVVGFAAKPSLARRDCRPQARAVAVERHRRRTGARTSAACMSACRWTG